MKKLFLALFIFIFLAKALAAQNFSTDFGRVGKDDIDLKVYAKDKEAEAVVLFDKGRSHFVDDYSRFYVLFERERRIKVLSEAGVKYAEIEIPFYQEGEVYEKILSLEAFTYNWGDGGLEKIPLESDAWHDEKINEFWKVRKFAFPNVKPGSIIEYKFQLRSPHIFNLQDWEFQSRIPTVYSEYVVETIPFYTYSWIMQGSNKFHKKQSYVEKGSEKVFAGVNYKDMVNEFVMIDVPAFTNEDYITSINDYIIKIDFQLSKISYPNGRVEEIMTTWPELIEEYEDHVDFGKFIKKCQKLAPKLMDAKAWDGKTKEEKFESVLDYVKTNYSWNNYNGKYASKTANNLVKDKYGNAADLNLFTIGLLRAAGIETYPVLISTRNHGQVKHGYPFNHFFNYVVIFAHLDDNNVLADATETFLAPNRIPSHCINDKGLLVKELDKEKWVGLKSTIPTITTTTIDLTLNEEIGEANVKTSSNEYRAARFMKNIGEAREKMVEHINEKNYDVNKESVRINPLKQPGDNYEYEFAHKFSPDFINNKIYVSPFLNEVVSENPLKQPTRNYPIDMVYATKDYFKSTIKIPEGYKIDYLPEGVKINNNLFEMEYKVVTNGGELDVSLHYFFKKAIYAASDYSKIKYYFNELVKKGNEKVVFVKKEI